MGGQSSDVQLKCPGELGPQCFSKECDGSTFQASLKRKGFEIIFYCLTKLNTGGLKLIVNSHGNFCNIYILDKANTYVQNIWYPFD